MDKLRTAFCFLFLFFIAATACVPATPVPSPTPQPTATTTLVPTSTPTLTPMSTRTPTMALERSATSLPEVKICSPVGVLVFEDIKKVIRGTFEMPDQYASQYRDNGHTGVDIGYFNFKGNERITGAPIQAVLSGKVTSTVKNRIPYGNTVILETPFDQIPAEFRAVVPIPEGQSLYHLYSHMRGLPPLIIGQTVNCGDDLGPAGQTGKATGPHLHFELRYGPPGAVFPGGMAYYTAPLTEDEWRNYVEWRMSGTYRLIDPMLFLTLPLPIPTPSSGNFTR